MIIYNGGLLSGFPFILSYLFFSFYSFLLRKESHKKIVLSRKWQLRAEMTCWQCKKSQNCGIGLRINVESSRHDITTS